jgi:hypothetical protein
MDSQATSGLTDFNEDTLENRHKLTGRGNMHSVALQTHYTTTPKSALDGLTPKAVTASDNLTLKTYSVRLLLTLQVLTLKTYSVRPNF